MSDFTMYRGDTVIFSGTATAAAGGAQDLTGCTLRFVAKKSKRDTDGNAIISLSSPSSGVAIVSAAGGTYTVTIPPSSTSSLTKPEYLFYNLQLTDGTGRVYTVDTGTITVNMDVAVTTP